MAAFLCRVFGHRWEQCVYTDMFGYPLARFWQCRRCGRIDNPFS